MAHNKDHPERWQPPISNEDLSFRLEQLETSVTDIRAEIGELVGLLKGTKWLLKALAWLVPLVGAGITVFSFFRGGPKV